MHASTKRQKVTAAAEHSGRSALEQQFCSRIPKQIRDGVSHDDRIVGCFASSEASSFVLQRQQRKLRRDRPVAPPYPPSKAPCQPDQTQLCVASAPTGLGNDLKSMRSCQAFSICRDDYPRDRDLRMDHGLGRDGSAINSSTEYPVISSAAGEIYSIAPPGIRQKIQSWEKSAINWNSSRLLRRSRSRACS